MRHKLRYSLPWAALLLLCGACSYNPNDYSCFSNIDSSHGWRYGQCFVYMPEIDDSIARGQLQILVRHSNDYPYSNLWVELQSWQSADSGRLHAVCDTFCIELADIYGNWLGKGLGASFQKTDTVYADFELANGSPLKLRHIMRPERVTGIEQTGLIFTANTTK